MKYPFTPELLDALPEELAELFRGLELWLLEEICSRLRDAGQLNEVTVQGIRALRAHGIDLADIKRAVAQSSGVGMDRLDRLLGDVAERNRDYYTGLLDAARVTAPHRLVDAQDIEAIRRQTADALRNITRSMGFLVDGGRTMLEPVGAYQWALDQAALRVQSGAASYNQAIADAVRQLADSGLKTVGYESGRTDSVDVAVRRAVMTGVNQLNQRYREQSMGYLGTGLVEVTAHAGARDTDGPNGWENHKKWQGKVYRWAEKQQDSLKKYPDFEKTCGYGSVTGIGGANCRHSFWPFIEGVSERTYTDEQLRHIDDGLGCEFEGQRYSAYQATQMQRRIEREIRRQQRRKTAFDAAGLSGEATAAGIKLRRLNEKYRQFSAAAGLPEQRERMQALYADKTLAKPPAPLAAPAKSGIIAPKDRYGGGSGVQTIGKIDRTKYYGISENICSDIVILADSQKEHIIKRRGKEFFDKYSRFFKEIVEDPDFIFKDKAHKHTAIASKTIALDEKNINLVIRLATEENEKGLKNSIITAIVENEKRYKQRLRNNTPLYKRE